MVLPLVLAFVHRPPGGAATGGGTDDVGLLRAAIGVVTALAENVAGMMLTELEQ